jgi:hypothetical protein
MSHWFKFPKRSSVGGTLNRARCHALPRKHATRSVPIRLEALEDRLAPAVFNVTTLADGGPGSGSLRAAILQSDTTPGPNTINLTIPGTFQLSLFGALHDGTHAALQIANQSLTIANASGGTAIIDGGGVDRVFDIEGIIPGGVTFTGLTMTGGIASSNSNKGSDTNGAAGDGGAIYSPQTNVTLNGCQIVNNVANSDAGGIWTDTASITLNSSTVSDNNANSNGGAIYSFAGNVSLTNSSVTDNASNGEGGGIDIGQGSITVTGSNISGNSGGNGGGIAMDAGSTGHLTISSSTVTDNVAGQGGGGIWQDSISGTTSVTASTISGNTANAAGGGIFTQSATVTITGSTINGNATNSSGGGFDAHGNTASISNSTFTGNFASDGGAVAFFGNSLNIDACNISGNFSETVGAGIEMTSSAAGATFTLTSSAVNSNSSTPAGTITVGFSGAGITAHLGSGGTVTVSNSTIDGNHSGSITAISDAGGLGILCTTLNMTNTSIDNNRGGDLGGGGIIAITTGTFSNVNIIGNHTARDVGGLYFQLGLTSLSMTNCNISDNFAGGVGGGMQIGGGQDTFTNCIINGNHAGFGQGGMGVFGSSLTMISCTISNNTSGGDAGGLFVDTNSTGSMTNCTINDNWAATNGGGIEIANAPSSSLTFTITGCTISGNRAGLDGGGIYDVSTGGAMTNIINETIFGNSAGARGGGIAMERSDDGSDFLEEATISGNSASLGGGAFSVGTASADVAAAIIAGNHANGGPDVSGNFSSFGSNIIGVEDDTCVSFTNGGTRSDQVGTVASPINPLLGPLENNGGPTFTMILRPGSPAIDAIPGLKGTDQRGFARPGAGQSAPSIGALETQLPSFVGTSANGAYVENLYETLLGRTADAGAVAFVTFLNKGGSRATVIADIVQSTEYETDEVQALYTTYLHRAADPGGLQHFVGVLNSGGTVEQVEEALVSSGEYFQIHGGQNDAFLTALYYDALGRGGSPAEQAGFLQGLNGGSMSRAQVAAAIFGSREYQNDLVEYYYQEFLGRNADPGGQAAWQAQLKSGMTDGQLVAALLGSGEGFAKRS